ncbi:uncharacterized protein G2W53_017969 [Senna tora]|uniref:Uncharacterized protein n=1 Tax=Senna tora TaxID=362788 RepID=A0A834WKM8_9FABA|nr:uncharacterized protein G2W53_017969 [Senna tora]
MPIWEIAPIALSQRMAGLLESARTNVGHPPDISNSAPLTL